MLNNLTLILNNKSVKVRILGGPQMCIFYCKLALAALALINKRITVIKLIGGIFVRLDCYLFIIYGSYIEVLDVSLRTNKHIYISENTVKAEHILVLNVRACTPFIHVYAKGVCTLFNIF